MFEAIIVATSATLLAFFARFKHYSILLALAFILITVFLSLGYEWGNDVPEYNGFYDSCINSRTGLFDFFNYSELSSKSEFGWVFINLLCQSFGFYGMRAILFCFENFIIYRFIKRNVSSDWYWLAVFVYVFNPYFMILSSSMMRQWLAMCLVILGLEFIEKKKWLVYILLVLIAATIHRSSLVCLPMIFLPKFFKYEFKSQVLIWFIPLFFVYFIFSGFFVDYVSSWLKQEDAYTNYMSASESTGMVVANIVKLAIYLFIFAGYTKVVKQKRIYMIIPLLFCLALPFYSVSGMASRLTLYFTAISIVAFPLYIESYRKPFNKVFMVSACLALVFYDLYVFFTTPLWMLKFGIYTSLFDVGIL